MGATAELEPTAARRHLRTVQLAGIALSGLALVVVLGSMDLDTTAGLMARAQPIVLAGVLGVLGVQLLLRAVRWRILLPRRPDGGPVPMRVAVPALLAGYLGNAVLPARLGEPLRAAIVARRERLGFAECFGATVIERVIDTATLAVVAFAAAVTLGTGLSILAITGAAAAVGATILLLLVCVGLTGVTTLLMRRLETWSHSTRIDTLAHRVVAFAEGVDRGRAPRRLAAAAGISFACWGLDASVFWLVAQAIDVSLSLPQAVLIAAVTVLVTAVPAAPGYVGTYELAATTVAAALGVPGAEALAVAVLAHVLTTVPLALAGVAALALTGTRLIRASTAQPWTEVPTPMTAPRLDMAGHP
jgi:uncharacterized protein (TIRG00374 family)